MKVLMINHFPLEGSGSGTYTKNLATQLVKLGDEVCIILPENISDPAQYEGVRLHPVAFTDPANPQRAPKGALDFNFPCFTTHPRSSVAFDDLTEKQMEEYLGAFQEAIDEEVRTFKPDIIHGQHLWILPSLAVGTGVPLVVTAHGTDLMGYEKWPDLRHFADQAMAAARKVICISADNEMLVRQIFPHSGDKVVRMRNGYNPDIFYPKELSRSAVLARYGLDDEGRDLILFAGKMTRFKGVDVLLEAAKIYGPACPNALTVLAGDGEERRNLEHRAKELGLQDLYFIGNVSQEALADLYRVADIDLIPSRREPFGLVAVEAMACGTPAVATNQGGLPDFVNSQVGALVAPEDPKDLARAVEETLERVLTHPEWRRAIAAYAKENYSQAAIIRELDDLYRGICDGV